MVNRNDYTEEAVAAARSVMIELVHLLGAYRDHAVLVGGWVPVFLISNPGTSHVGSMDIDLALDHRHIREDGYKTIRRLLSGGGYEQTDQKFIFLRRIRAKGREITVQVDLLSGEYGGTVAKRRHQRIGDLKVRKARGCDIAFESSVLLTLSGELPGGAKDSVKIHVASLVPFLVMKGMALDERLKEKDAYDIHYCLVNYPGGLAAIASEFKPHLANKLVREGLNKIAKHFTSIDSIGPRFVADFENLGTGEERDILRRDAFERVQALMRMLNPGESPEKRGAK